MCVQFKTVKLVVTTEPARMLNHDGSIVTNEDCPVGTVLAYDKNGNLFYCADEAIAEFFRERASLGPVICSRSEHYRDYWRHISSGPDTPYGSSFRNAPHKVVEEVK